jgi:hypothetical protein
LPHIVANFLSILPFCCGVFGAVISNLIFRVEFLLTSANKVLFSPALSHLIVLISKLWIFLTVANHDRTVSHSSILADKN